MSLYLNAATAMDTTYKVCGPMFKKHFHEKYSTAANEEKWTSKKQCFCGLKWAFTELILQSTRGLRSTQERAVLIWWACSETEWMFSKCSITYLTIFWVLLSTGRAERYFFFLKKISAVHQRFYLNCSYKKLMKALSCWATKWQEWIPVRWNLLKIQLSKHFCINISLSDSAHALAVQN